MKAFYFVLAASSLLMACSTTPSKNPVAADSSRIPSSADGVFVLKDKHGDTEVIFCGRDTAVAIIDPNRCKEAMAKGAAGCTKLATYVSKPLKVEVKGKSSSLINQDGSVAHTISQTSATTFSIFSPTDEKPTALTITNLNNAQLAEAEYYCEQ